MDSTHLLENLRFVYLDLNMMESFECWYTFIYEQLIFKKSYIFTWGYIENNTPTPH
jgi:hypothetical protein